MITSLLDRFMDFTVAPGYTNLGYAIRARAWEDRMPSLRGRTVLVTGGTSGLGRAAAEGFARLDARVLLLARNPERGARAVEEIASATGNPHVELVIGDLSDMASVRAAATDVQARTDALHVLVNNAGSMIAERTESVDGIEMTFATNVVGPFLLTELLTDLLAAGAPSRIINVSSGGMYTAKLDLEDPQTERREYDPPAVYARTKRAEVVLTEEWARRLGSRGIVVHAMHPGWADTPGVQTSLPRFHQLTKPLLRDAEQGADTIVWLGAAEEPAARTGEFWHDRRTRATHRLPSTREDPADGVRLWELCARLSGLQPAAAR